MIILFIQVRLNKLPEHTILIYTGTETNKMPKAKYESIYRDLKDQIEAGEYPSGKLLPSENVLCETFGCSRNTIRRAVGMLASDGYVQSQHGKGIWSIYEPSDQTTFVVGGIEPFAEAARRNGREPGTRLIDFKEITVDKEMSKRSGFPEGSEVYYIERVRLLDGKPLIFDINLFLKSAIPGLTPELAAGSVYAYAENEKGLKVTTSRRKITAERASSKDKHNLDLKDYDFVCVISSQTYSADGTMFEYTRSRHRPDCFCFIDTAFRPDSGNRNTALVKQA